MIQLEWVLDGETFAWPALLTTRQWLRLTHGYHRLPEVNLLAIEVQHPDKQLSHALLVLAATAPDTEQRFHVGMEPSVPLANTYFRFCVSVQLCVTKSITCALKLSLDKICMYCRCTVQCRMYMYM